MTWARPRATWGAFSRRFWKRGGATLTALDECSDMVAAYAAPGRAVVTDMTRFAYKPFDVAVAFLALMFLAVPARRKLLARLRQQLRPGGAIIVFDKLVPPGGYGPAR